MGKKKKCRLPSVCIGAGDTHNERCGSIELTESVSLKQTACMTEKELPSVIDLKVLEDGGVFFGGLNQFDKGHFVGMPGVEDGNIIVIGGSGSGKSFGVIKPTLLTWREAICATDIKGELSRWYSEYTDAMEKAGIRLRPAYVFDPMKINGPSYDPLWLLEHDDESNLISNIMEIVHEMIPDASNADPFWVESERAVLDAAFLHFYRRGLSFSQIVAKVFAAPLSELCQVLIAGGDDRVKYYLGELDKMKPETRACIDRGLKNALLPFAEEHISHMFRGSREGAHCINWDDLKDSNIFLRVPEDKIEQWYPAINMIFTQLIRYLERRPDQFSEKGKDNLRTLIMMDEFPRFGKLEIITSALATLRSKNVHFLLINQSLAQLDAIYGVDGRRIILDNCQWKEILRVDDPDTQELVSKMIGTSTFLQYSKSVQLDNTGEKVGVSEQIAEVQRPTVLPHTLSTLSKAILLCPYGYVMLKKFKYGKSFPISPSLKDGLHEYTKETKRSAPPQERVKRPVFSIADSQPSRKMQTLEERVAEADQHISQYRQQKPQGSTPRPLPGVHSAARQDLRGELVETYLPDIGADPDKLECLLKGLSNDPQLVEKILHGSGEMCPPSATWARPEKDNV